MAAKDKAMATKEDNAVAVTVPAYLQAGKYADFVDNGMENADAESYAIPFLRILQSGSPQVKKTSGQAIEGATEGMLFNTVTQELFDPAKVELRIIPAYYRRAFMEWATREQGGGYVAEHSVKEGTILLGECERDEKNRDILPNGNQLSDTRYHYVLLVREDGTAEPVIITMERSQLKRSKRLNSDIDLKKKSTGIPYQQALSYRVKLTAETKDDDSWWSWDITYAGPVMEQALFDSAVEFHDRVRGGEVKDATDSLGDAVEEM